MGVKICVLRMKLPVWLLLGCLSVITGKVYIVKSSDNSVKDSEEHGSDYGNEVKCDWSKWSEWSQGSETCGDITVQRSRTCDCSDGSKDEFGGCGNQPRLEKKVNFIGECNGGKDNKKWEKGDKWDNAKTWTTAKNWETTKKWKSTQKWENKKGNSGEKWDKSTKWASDQKWGKDKKWETTKKWDGGQTWKA